MELEPADALRQGRQLIRVRDIGPHVHDYAVRVRLGYRGAAHRVEPSLQHPDGGIPDRRRRRRVAPAAVRLHHKPHVTELDRLLRGQPSIEGQHSQDEYHTDATEADGARRL